MKYHIDINQAVIVENGWHMGSDLNTWALFDFLCFFNNAPDHKTIRDGEFKWINYKYIADSLPLCDFYKQKIKKHLEILADFGLIALAKDESGNVYFKLLPKHRILFEKFTPPSKILPTQEKNYPESGEKFTHPQVKFYPPPGENFTHNNNKESRNKNINNNKEQKEKETKENFSLEKQNQNLENQEFNLFQKFWSLYPRKTGITACEIEFRRASISDSAEFIIQSLERHIKHWKQEQGGDYPKYVPNPLKFLQAKLYRDEIPLTHEEKLSNMPDECRF